MLDSDDQFFTAYQGYLLRHGHPPPSVFAFCESVETPESEFFKRFASFSVLERRLWADHMTRAIDLARHSNGFNDFSFQQKYLTLCYQVLDVVLENRSFYLLRFPARRSRRNWIDLSDGLRSLFSKVTNGQDTELCAMRRRFADELRRQIDEAHNSDELTMPAPLQQRIPELLFGHVLWLIQYYLDDESEGFEKTDALVEKSTRLAFEALQSNVIGSGLDLLRFLAGDRVSLSGFKPRNSKCGSSDGEGSSCGS